MSSQCFFYDCVRIIRVNSVLLHASISFYYHRPSLNELRQHAFIAHNKIPSSLPSSCTYSAPLWTTDEFGELQVANPTSALDIKISSSAPAASNNEPKFHIYDEIKNNNGHSTSSKPVGTSADNNLIGKLNAGVASCRIADEEVREPPPTASAAQDPNVSPPSTVPDEMSVLEKMHSNLEVCLTNFERIANGGEKMDENKTAIVEETKWVSRFVDYTSKYGLGFLLNDGRYVYNLWTLTTLFLAMHTYSYNNTHHYLFSFQLWSLL